MFVCLDSNFHKIGPIAMNFQFIVKVDNTAVHFLKVIVSYVVFLFLIQIHKIFLYVIIYCTSDMSNTGKNVA